MRRGFAKHISAFIVLLALPSAFANEVTYSAENDVAKIYLKKLADSKKTPSFKNQVEVDWSKGMADLQEYQIQIKKLDPKFCKSSKTRSECLRSHISELTPKSGAELAFLMTCAQAESLLDSTEADKKTGQEQLVTVENYLIVYENTAVENFISAKLKSQNEQKEIKYWQNLDQEFLTKLYDKINQDIGAALKEAQPKIAKVQDIKIRGQMKDKFNELIRRTKSLKPLKLKVASTSL